MGRLLAVEDSDEARVLIERALGRNHEVEFAETAAEALARVDGPPPDLILIDVGLPDRDGFHLCSSLRHLETTRRVPIIFLSASTGVDDKLMAFDLGADDYVTKPFQGPELLARVEARLRSAQANGTAGNGHLLRTGDLELDLGERVLRVYGEDGSTRIVEPTHHEFLLLRVLAESADRTVSRGELMERVWSPTTVTPRTIDTHVGNLRRKLGSLGRRIESVRGSGYRLRAADPSSI